MTFIIVSINAVSRIWDHLKDIVSTKQITVIITTHYIEETKQADTVSV